MVPGVDPRLWWSRIHDATYSFARFQDARARLLWYLPSVVLVGLEQLSSYYYYCCGCQDCHWLAVAFAVMTTQCCQHVDRGMIIGIVAAAAAVVAVIVPQRQIVAADAVVVDVTTATGDWCQYYHLQ